ncbi:MAG TPA: PHB depolymerase family esterase [Polyangiaceae bacterium]|nr:PHB depolymerase family esterase [Polyangiaceae bacterium]
MNSTHPNIDIDALLPRGRAALASESGVPSRSASRSAWIIALSFGFGLVACGSNAPVPGAGGGSGGTSTVGGGSGAGGSANAAHGGTGANAAAGTAASSGGTTAMSGPGGVSGTANGGANAGGVANATGSGGHETLGAGGVAATGGAGTSSGGGAAGLASMGGRMGAGGASGSANGGSGPAAGAPASGGSAGTGSSSVTCPSTVLKSGDTNQTVQVGSVSRTYILHVPSAYKGTSAVPLVVDFHPLGGSGSSEESSSPYKAQTDPEGVVTAYPNGESGPSGGAWNVGPCCVANVDDIGFAKALVAQVETKACIDTKRVYAVGFSMGGGMSHYVACHAADVFAAVAPASFDLLTENEDDCTPPRPIAEISFRSSNDPVVPYAGGYSPVVTGMPVTFLGAVATFQKWAEINGCTGSPTATDSNDCQYYTSCSGGVQVGLCTMDAGHAPGNATIGWPFIKQYTLP